MAELYANVDGQMVPLADCIWVFSHRCGHPFAVLVADRWPTEEQAWQGFYETARERDAARKRGVQATLANTETIRADDEFWRQMKDGCECTPEVSRHG